MQMFIRTSFSNGSFPASIYQSAPNFQLEAENIEIKKDSDQSWAEPDLKYFNGYCSLIFILKYIGYFVKHASRTIPTAIFLQISRNED